MSEDANADPAPESPYQIAPDCGAYGPFRKPTPAQVKLFTNFWCLITLGPPAAAIVCGPCTGAVAAVIALLVFWWFGYEQYRRGYNLVYSMIEAIPMGACFWTFVLSGCVLLFRLRHAR